LFSTAATSPLYLLAVLVDERLACVRWRMGDADCVHVDCLSDRFDAEKLGLLTLGPESV
jgi:hypothetical protein